MAYPITNQEISVETTLPPTSIITKVEKTLQPSKSSFYLKMTKSYQNKIRDKSTLKHNPETKEPQKAKKLI